MNMIKKGLVALAVVGALGATYGHSATYTPDTLLGSTDLADSGDGTTEVWVSGVVGATVELTDVTVVYGFQKDDAGNWYIDIDPYTVGYFLLKFGTGSTSAVNSYVFSNVNELTKLVWTDAQVNGLMGTDGGRLSHYRISDTTVPVPGTLGLLGLGLAGLGMVRRKQKA